MSKGTVIYIGGFEMPDKNAAAHRVKNNGKLFEKSGYKVVYIGITKKNVSKNSLQQDYYQLQYPENQLQWLKYLTDIKELKKIIMEQENVKAVVLYNYQSIAYSRLSKWCQKRGIKVIADCTEWYGNGSGNILFKIIKKIDTEFRMKKLHKNSDGIIVISEFLAEYYKESSRIIELPPLVDLNENKWKGDITSQDTLTITYAGSPGKEKDNLTKIINYFQLLNNHVNYQLNIIGISEKEYIEIHDNSYQRKNKNIKFLGRITHKESLNYVKNSDFTIFFRDNNITTKAGFPTKFVESISAHVPVITNDNSNVKKYLNQNEDGFLMENTDFDAFKKFLSQDINYLKGIKSKVNNRKFHYEEYHDEFYNFIKSILE